MSRRKHKKRKKPSEGDGPVGVEASAAPSNEDEERSPDAPHEDDEVSPTESSAGDPGEAPDHAGEGEGAEFDAEESEARIEEDVQELKARADDMRELAMRKQAEFENYRKRVERERAETIRHASSELVKDILPVLDNLERAIEASASGSEEQLREGVGIVYRQFKDILEKRGLAEVDSEGREFDPHVHEAVSRIETDEHPEGRIVEVFQKGYWFKDKLLRPAMVAVALPPSDTNGEESPDEASTSASERREG